MSTNNNLFAASEEFSYSSNNNLITLQNVSAPQTPCPTSVLIELRNEVRSLKNALDSNNEQMKNLTKEVQQCRKTIGELTEEVITVKLENRKYKNSITFNQNPRFDKLPFVLMEELNSFNAALEKEEGLLDEFKIFIGKVGGDGQSMFLRSAIRKVFTDELASAFTWKGTSEKPSAENLYITTVIKNICHFKYKAEDKEINSILQKHFVHAKERANKRKRC